jgi:L-lactate dehydrogenase (cytochrome)
MNTTRFVNVEDLRRAARRRLPRSVFDYIDGGADGEVTLRENMRAFEDIGLRPLCAVETPPPDLRTTVLGAPLSMPVILAPVGSSRMFWPRGEEVAASVADGPQSVMFPQAHNRLHAFRGLLRFLLEET